MLLYKNLTLKNFLSVGAVTQAINLDGTPLTLVLGANTDTNGELSRNGAGKSTILQAISYALYGTPLTKIKVGNLINNTNGKEMLVTLEFERNGKRFRIERGKKPDVTKFYVNGTDVTAEKKDDETQGENVQTQVLIEREIGMSHKLFKLILALNTFTDPFLKQGATDQRNIMEELFGIMVMSHKGETLKSQVKDTKKIIESEEARVRAVTEANSRIEGALQQAQLKAEAWEVTHKAKIDQLLSDLEVMAAIDFETELAQFEAHDAIMAKRREFKQQIETEERAEKGLLDEITRLTADENLYRHQASEGSAKQVERLRAEAKRSLDTVTRHDGDANALKEEARALESAPQDGSCSLCGQSIDGTHHHEEMQAKVTKKVADLYARADRELANADQRRTEAAQIEAEADKLLADSETRKQEWLDKANAVTVKIDEAKARLPGIAATLSGLRTDLSQVGDLPELIFGSRDEVYRTREEHGRMQHALETEQAASNPHLDQVEGFRSTLQVIEYDALNAATDLLKHQEFLVKLLMDKNSFIRKKIMNQNLALVNKRLSYYLEKLFLPHNVVFQSDLSVEIDLMGRDYDFEQLSRGEMNRVIMALSWSFRDVWESMNESCNLLWVDELLDQGTDTQGVEAALGLLKEMTRKSQKNIFLISHRDDLQSRIDRTLLVTKENGFTAFDTSAL